MWPFKKKPKESSPQKHSYDTSEIQVYIHLACSILQLSSPNIQFLDYICVRLQGGEVIGIDTEDAEEVFKTTDAVFIGGFCDEQSNTIYIARYHGTEHRFLRQEEVLFSVLQQLRRMWQSNTGAGSKEELDQAIDASAFAIAFIANKTPFTPDLFMAQMEVYPDDDFFLRANTLSFLYFPGNTRERLADFLSIMQMFFGRKQRGKKRFPTYQQNTHLDTYVGTVPSLRLPKKIHLKRRKDNTEKC